MHDSYLIIVADRKVYIIYINFDKVFNKLIYESLLLKLKKYGWKILLLSWLTKFVVPNKIDKTGFLILKYFL